MEIIRFKKILTSGFDIEFNINDVFYSFTKAELNGEIRYFIGNENHTEHSNFPTVEDMLNYQINGEALSKIIETTDEEDISF